MTLADRLRATVMTTEDFGLLREAADEIERLQADRDVLIRFVGQSRALGSPLVWKHIFGELPEHLRALIEKGE